MVCHTCMGMASCWLTKDSVHPRKAKSAIYDQGLQRKIEMLGVVDHWAGRDAHGFEQYTHHRVRSRRFEGKLTIIRGRYPDR